MATLLHFGHFTHEFRLLIPRSVLMIPIEFACANPCFIITPSYTSHRDASKLSVSDFSSILFQGSPIRQVSYYTLLSGFQLPWPPSYCLYGRTPFGFNSAWTTYFKFGKGSSLIAHSAYQSWPTTDINPSDLLRRDCLLITSLTLERHLKGTQTPSHYLNREWFEHLCYPEGNFERNQLLGGSISLSPLFHNEANDLHVSIATDLH